MTIKWTKQQAKEFMVNYHMFYDRLSSHDGIKQVFSRLQSIQYDPLDVVGKNAELVLQARIRDFRRNDLYEALYKERYLIDGWDKMMGIYQTNDYPYMAPVREVRSLGEINTLKHRLQLHALDYVDEVLEILAESPKMSTEIKIGESMQHRWGRTKPSSATLDYLFQKGEIGIRLKRNTQKQYDLIKNLLPKELLIDKVWDEDSFGEYYLYRRIKSMGLVWNKSGVHFSGPVIQGKQTRTKYLNTLLDKGKIEQVEIEGIKEPLYVVSDYSDYIKDVPNEMRFLAPLDNFLWDRDLVKAIFDFDYKWEVYTPLKDRKYGYYVLPILCGADLVGRVEFEKYRGETTLTVKDIWWESKPYKRLFNKEVKHFLNYLKG